MIYLIIAVSGLHFSTESTLFRRFMMKTKNLHSDFVRKNLIVQEMRFKRGSLTHKWVFFGLFNFIDSDKRTSLRAFQKKNQMPMKIELGTCI